MVKDVKRLYSVATQMKPNVGAVCASAGIALPTKESAVLDQRVCIKHMLTIQFTVL
jgi:hypothetical protein